jgi:hypothetical protein
MQSKVPSKENRNAAWFRDNDFSLKWKDLALGPEVGRGSGRKGLSQSLRREDRNELKLRSPVPETRHEKTDPSLQ